MASFIGICLVGVATAIPGTMASRHDIASTGPPDVSSTVIVETTTGDLIITLGILVSLDLGPAAVDPVLDVKLGEGRLCLQILEEGQRLGW